MTTASPPDWFAIGQSIFLFIIGCFTALNAWRSRQNSTTLREVHVLVNSQMTLTKKALAEVSAAKAAITKTATDEAAAQIALDDYLKQVERQSRASD